MERKFVSREENLVMRLRFPGLGGVNVSINGWDGDNWQTLYDKLVFADNQYEAVYGALYQIGFTDEDCEWLCSDWGFELPDDEEDN
jgi:hypothetical protein